MNEIMNTIMNCVIYFGFALADSMFVGCNTITRKVLTPEEAKDLIAAGIVPCVNPSHKATIEACRIRYGIEVEIPDIAPKVTLAPGKAVLVMGVRGLPRLDASRHEYTSEEIDSASFEFSLYTVID